MLCLLQSQMIEVATSWNHLPFCCGMVVMYVVITNITQRIMFTFMTFNVGLPFHTFVANNVNCFPCFQGLPQITADCFPICN